MHDIVVFTGSRADFSLLHPLINSLAQVHNVTVLASGGHLREDQGYTIETVMTSSPCRVVQCDIGSDRSTARSISRALYLYTDVLDSLRCSLFIVLGDRYEAFAAALAANLKFIPIVHIHGGEETLGAQDNYFRNCITKLSSFHFVSCGMYRKRVIQMGESPDRVFNTGALGIHNVLKYKKLLKNEFLELAGIKRDTEFFLITLHPETMSDNASFMIASLLEALDKFKDYHMLFTASNTDNGGDIINKAIQEYCRGHTNCTFIKSLGLLRYINAMRHASLIIGNSSSAIIEAPSLNCHIVDIGSRQGGRERAECVINTAADCKSIEDAVRRSLLMEESHVQNPYYKDNTLSLMLSVIGSLDTGNVIKKAFYDLEA